MLVKTNQTIIIQNLLPIIYHCLASNLVKRLICQPNTCQNGGTCTEDGSAIHCNCQEDFKGKFCEGQKDIDTLSHLVNVPILYSLKSTENQTFSGVFRGNIKWEHWPDMKITYAVTPRYMIQYIYDSVGFRLLNIAWYFQRKSCERVYLVLVYLVVLVQKSISMTFGVFVHQAGLGSVVQVRKLQFISFTLNLPPVERQSFRKRQRIFTIYDYLYVRDEISS